MTSKKPETGTPTPYSSEDIDQRASKIERDAGKKTLRRVLSSLHPLLNLKNYHPPSYHKELDDFFIYRHRVHGQTTSRHLLESHEHHFDTLLNSLKGIPGIDLVLSEESFCEIISTEVGTEIENRENGGTKTTAETVRTQLFRGMAARIDWHLLYFVLHGVELENGVEFHFSPIEIFTYTDEKIDKICAPPKDSDDSMREFSESTARSMKENRIDRIGLKFPLIGDKQEAIESSDAFAMRCVYALRFACCVAYPQIASSETAHIGIEDCLGGHAPFTYLWTQRCYRSRYSHLQGLHCSDLMRVKRA